MFRVRSFGYCSTASHNICHQMLIICYIVVLQDLGSSLISVNYSVCFHD